MSKLAALIILDGFGLREETYGNAVAQANKPNFDRYWNAFPHNQLEASGLEVGLPEGQMGNSEVGHLNIGAGRVVYQNLTRINQSIKSEEFYENESFVQTAEAVKKAGKALHLFGLLSDGGVHSHIDHLIGLLELAKRVGVERVYIHGFLDGRDVGQQTALGYIERLETAIAEIGIGEIATISGRYYAMDRDKRWERVKLAYDAIKYGEGPTATNAQQIVRDSYKNEVYDEFVIPAVLTNDAGEPVAQVATGDGIIFFNFRPDRAIQLSRAFAEPGFDLFDLGKGKTDDIHFVQMTKYSDVISGLIAFDTVDLVNTVGEVISNENLTQLRIAETEKYPHVTYFMSGGREAEYPGERRILINSPKVATYDLQPEMSVYELTDQLLAELDKKDLNAVILNFANPDMVGHSGLLTETINAIEAVDECLGKIVDKITELGGEVVITADHGNSDEVVTLTGEPMTAHTTNPVPVIVTRPGVTLRSGGKLADLAPTLLDLLDVETPAEMTGTTLINK